MSFISPFTDADFPVSIAHAYRISKRSTIIYTGVLMALIIALGSMPFIYIPVNVKASGILQPETERYELMVPVNGKIVKVLIRDNQKVGKGDTVLLLDASLTDEQARSLEERKLLLKKFLADLNNLLKYSNKPQFDDLQISLQTGRYIASLKQFLQEIQDRKNTRGQKERIFNRYNYLYNNSVITLAEFEKFKFEYEQSVSEYRYLIKQYRLQWQSDVIAQREELRQLKTKRSELQQQRNLYTIISPYSGSIQNLKALESGAYAFANQKIAEVSPDGKLKAYCFVKPADIGQISVGQRVSFQVDAFNYIQWGLLRGKVIDISDDIVLLNNEIPVFKVKCTLDKDYFELDDSQAYLKKGMNLTARFSIGEYNLFQLLHKETEDLIEPGINERD